MPKLLHAICGNNTKARTTREFNSPEWEEVRMDPQTEVKPDVVSSLMDMSMIEDASFDAVFTAHSLERLYAHEVTRALSNIARVLKDDGHLIITCADIQSACVLIAEDKLLDAAYESPAGPVAPIDILYGFRPALAAGFERHACKCGFTSRALLGTLGQAGFASKWAARNPHSFTLVAIACKQQKTEEDMKELATKHFG